MVSETDVKYKKSSSGVGLGGSKSATLITSATPNNFFDTVTGSQAVSGLVEYRCFYVENGHATEDMDDCDIFQNSDNPNSSYSTIQWGLEPYRYPPYRTYNGTSDFDEEPDAAELRLSIFTVSAWFNSSKADYTSFGFIVNKGGDGSDSAGENNNYGIWFGTSERIIGGFETGAGVDNNVTSVN